MGEAHSAGSDQGRTATRVERRDGLVIVTLDRPRRKNAINAAKARLASPCGRDPIVTLRLVGLELRKAGHCAEQWADAVVAHCIELDPIDPSAPRRRSDGRSLRHDDP